MIALRLTVGLNRNTLTITTKTRLAGWVTSSIFHSEDQRAQTLDNRVGAEFQLGETTSPGSSGMCKSSFKTPADWAIHILGPSGFHRTPHGPDLASVQKLAEISIEVMQAPGAECSSKKSSTKVSLLAHRAPSLVSRVFFPAVGTKVVVLGFADRTIFCIAFLRLLIADPIVRLIATAVVDVDPPSSPIKSVTRMASRCWRC